MLEEESALTLSLCSFTLFICAPSERCVFGITLALLSVLFTRTKCALLRPGAKQDLRPSVPLVVKTSRLPL